MNTDQPSRDQKPGDSLRLRAFVVRPGPIHHEDTKTRRITKSFRNAESCLSCSRGAAANEQVQAAANERDPSVRAFGAAGCYTVSGAGSKRARLTWRRSICKSIASSGLTVGTLMLEGCDNLSKEQLREIAEVKRAIEQDPALINKLDAAGETPLHVAVINNYVSLLTWLLDHGADINIKDRHGDTPLRSAVIWDRTPHMSVIGALLGRGADVNDGNTYGDTPLHVAATFAETSVIKLLLSEGANPNAQAGRGAAPLHYASRRPTDPAKDYKAAIRLLLGGGAKVNIQDQSGSSPLHAAVMIGNTETVDTLLENGATIDLKTNNGSTPLHIAAIVGHASVAEVLVKKGAKVNERDNRGHTPPYVALKEPAMHYEQNKKGPVNTMKVVEVLKHHGAVE